MARLVAASTPGLVERSRTIEFLVTWDVLVRSVCREVADRPDALSLGWRGRAALGQLHRWKASVSFDTLRPSLEIPADCAELLAQVEAGEQVCATCLWSQGADKFDELESDFRRIDEAVTSYWDKYRSPVCPPELPLI